MSDIFISYSRLDKEFVGELRDALAEQKQDVWIDWESIPPSQSWWNEIKKGIARTNNFAIVLSPNSIASPICQLEIEYARQLGKRIIPILYLDYNREEAVAAMATRLADPEQDATRVIWENRQPHAVYDGNDSEIKHINYFFFRDEDDFESRFAELLKVIQTDYDYKEQHTTLELRAQEWNRRGQDASFLLLDAELEQAAQWLESSQGKQPEPTDLQRAFIQASEKRTRQLRNIRRASIVGIITTILASIFAAGATYLSFEASNNANSANTQVAAVQPTLDAGNTRVAGVEPTLISADATLDSAATRVANVEPTVEAANQLVADAQLELTQIAPTLTTVAQQLDIGNRTIESARLASIARDVRNNPALADELAALLLIRALKTAYTAQADAELTSLMDTLASTGIFRGHTASVNALSLSPDGTILASGSGQLGRDRAHIILWDIATMSPILTIESQAGRFMSLAFSSDGSTLLSGSAGKMQLWDVATGELIQSFEGAEHAISKVAFTPDGESVLGASWDGNSYLWNINNGEIRRVFPSTSDRGVSVYSLAISNDGSVFVSGSSEEVLLWDTQSGRRLNSFETNFGTSYALRFSPDGNFVIGSTCVEGNLSSCQLGQLRLWDISSGELVKTYTGHNGAINDVEFSPDGQTMISAGSDGVIILWDVDSATQLRVFEGHTGGVTDILFLEQDIFVSASTDSTIRLWNNAKPTRVFEGHAWKVNSVDFMPDGKHVLSSSQDTDIRLWDIETAQTELVFSGHSNDVFSVAVAPDGLTAISGAANNDVFLWDVATGTVLHHFVGHSNSVNKVAFSPTGPPAISASEDGTARLWVGIDTDTSEGDLIQTFEGHEGAVNSAAFSPDGTSILTASDDGSLRLWDVETGETLKILSGHNAIVFDAIFNLNGRLAISASEDQTLRLWNLETGQAIYTFSGHTGSVVAVALSPDGKTILSSSRDMTLRLWDLATGQTLRVYQGHTDGVTSGDFSPDGKFVISGSLDTTLRIWDTDYHDFITYACSRVFRDFTADERSLYNIEDNEATCP